MATTSSSWWTDTLAIFTKEVRSELRTRHALNAILLFAVTSVVVVGFGTASALPDGFTIAALFWIVVFFAPARRTST